MSEQGLNGAYADSENNHYPLLVRNNVFPDKNKDPYLTTPSTHPERGILVENPFIADNQLLDPTLRGLMDEIVPPLNTEENDALYARLFGEEGNGGLVQKLRDAATSLG